MEFRGHENDVEVVVFAPIAAYGPIRELAGIPVCSALLVYVLAADHSLRIQISQSGRAHISQVVAETR